MDKGLAAVSVPPVFIVHYETKSGNRVTDALYNKTAETMTHEDDRSLLGRSQASLEAEIRDQGFGMVIDQLSRHC